MLETPHIYSILEEKQNGFVLVKDGRQVFCHKLQPIPTQGNFAGQVSLLRMPCCTNCGRATIFKQDEKTYYEQSCEGTINQFILEIKDNPSEKHEGKIISL